MTYKGQEIGIPTLELIKECINQWKLRVAAQEVYDYWTLRNWLTKKGQAVKTLESACNVANSLFVQRERKGGNISKSEDKLTIIREYFESKAELTIKCLEVLKAANHPLFAEVYYELHELGFTSLQP
jgi:hypothetical protein